MPSALRPYAVEDITRYVCICIIEHCVFCFRDVHVNMQSCGTSKINSVWSLRMRSRIQCEVCSYLVDREFCFCFKDVYLNIRWCSSGIIDWISFLMRRLNERIRYFACFLLPVLFFYFVNFIGSFVTVRLRYLLTRFFLPIPRWTRFSVVWWMVPANLLGFGWSLNVVDMRWLVFFYGFGAKKFVVVFMFFGGSLICAGACESERSRFLWVPCVRFLEGPVRWNGRSISVKWMVFVWVFRFWCFIVVIDGFHVRATTV